MIYCIKPVITGSLSEKDPYSPDIRIPDRYGSFFIEIILGEHPINRIAMRDKILAVHPATNAENGG